MNEGDDGVAKDEPREPGIGGRARHMPPTTLDLKATPLSDGAGATHPATGDSPLPPPATDQLAAAEAAASASPDSSKTHAPPPPRSSGRAGFWWAGGIAAAVVLLAALAVTRPWDAGGVAAPDESAQLAGRLARVETQLGDIARRPPPPDGGTQVAALGQRLAAMEAQLREVANRPAPAGGDPAQAAALGGRFDDIAKRLDAVEQTARRLDEIAARMSRVETAVAAPRPAAPDPALDKRLGAIETGVKALGDRVASVAKRLDEVAATAREADRHAETATAVAAAPSAADQAIRFAFLATTLRSAVERGAPFESELVALKPLVADPARLVALAPFAAAGVPSAAVLSRELSTLLPALTVAAAPAKGGDGLLDRLQTTTQHLVRIRRVGEQPGDDPATVVARIDAKAAHGDVTGALAEFAKLSPVVRAPAEAWIARARQRVAALDAAQALAGDALAALKPAP